MGKKFAEQVAFVQKVVILHPDDSGKLILLKRNSKDSSRPADVDIPGGGVKKGEQHEESLKREVLEETGLEITDLKPVLVSSKPYDDDYFLFIGYCARGLSADVTLNGAEHDGYEWADLSKFVNEHPDHVLSEQVRAVLDGYRY